MAVTPPILPTSPALVPIQATQEPSTPMARPATVQPRMADTVELHAGTDRLVAGRVTQGVDFATGPLPTNDPQAIPLYTRGADLVEAAVGATLGRRLDLRA